MIEKQEARRATEAEQLMAIDVFAALLASTDPSLLGKSLTMQLQELTGARTVMLIAHTGDTMNHTILNVSPERRSDLFSDEELALFCPECSSGELPRSVEDFADDTPLKAILERSRIKSVLRFPLSGTGGLVGMILLLDLPGLERIEETVAIVNHLAPVIALALRNALSHERIETRVSERTAELKAANEQLNRSLNEKDTLLRELYHRTKNTLQVISGILKLQALKFSGNNEVSALVDITDGRIQAISLVHQMLYQSQDLSRISIKDYINKLALLILENHNEANRTITLSLEIGEHFFLLDTAIPLGLILTELMTNSLAHAFPLQKEGCISIGLSVSDTNSATLIYSDNGVGVPEGYDFGQQNTLGLQLITNIAQQQMGGTVVFDNVPGIRCIIRFTTTLYRKRV